MLRLLECFFQEKRLQLPLGKRAFFHKCKPGPRDSCLMLGERCWRVAEDKALKMLKVLVKGATNLPDVDRLSGKSDPYAVVSFRGMIQAINHPSFTAILPRFICDLSVKPNQTHCLTLNYTSKFQIQTEWLKIPNFYH